MAGPFIVSMGAPALWMAFTVLLDEAGDDEDEEAMIMTRPAEALLDTVLLFLKAVSKYTIQLRQRVHNDRTRMLVDISASALRAKSQKPQLQELQPIQGLVWTLKQRKIEDAAWKMQLETLEQLLQSGRLAAQPAEPEEDDPPL